ncbi:MAG: 5-(carboxyamino)imidazole ribonucleotide synthase [Bergeyella sp.]|nr:5-(carboxyamino)imidazole ribonucleotide synthase [Bergeyella sp.]
MRIGILGGGQLGRMFIQEALKYDNEFYVLDPSADCPSANIAQVTLGNFNNYDEVLAFGQGKEVLTMEIEHINVAALETLEKQGVKVIPSPGIVKMIQQKILQKRFYKEKGIPSPNFSVYRKGEAVPDRSFPFVQKLNTGGYDGKGVQVIENKGQLSLLWEEDSVLEDLVEVKKELSVIVAKNENGETRTFPVTEMVADPELNLLDFNICPAEISPSVGLQVQNITRKFLSCIDSPGLFAIELFWDKNDKVWVNEIAPRLHNSGHQTQEGNYNSQFEQFYRVLCNLPLADTGHRAFSGMLNLVGEKGYEGKVIYEGLEEVLRLPKTYVHLYGKKETRSGRKMGHINVVADTRAELVKKLSQIKSGVKVRSRGQRDM